MFALAQGCENRLLTAGSNISQILYIPYQSLFIIQFTLASELEVFRSGLKSKEIKPLPAQSVSINIIHIYTCIFVRQGNMCIIHLIYKVISIISSPNEDKETYIYK